MKTSVLGFLLLVVVLAVSTCGPGVTPTPEPTATPEPALATRVEDIVGTWEGIGFDGFFHRFNADGTFQTGISYERLLAGPDMSGVFRFEGTHFLLTELESPNLKPCQAGAETGTYEIQLLANGNINFVVIEDKCGHRRRTMGLEHRPVQAVTTETVLATRIEDIVGAWEGIGSHGLYQRFNPDGTCEVALALDSLAAGKPDVLMSFRFEGTQLFLAEIESPGLPSCGSEAGIYEVQLLSSGNIKFVAIQDPCAPRRGSTAQEHKPILSLP